MRLGQRPTMGPDVILGTKRSDTIPLAGGDYVCAGPGDWDLVHTHPYDFDSNARSYVRGGPGGDHLESYTGNDVLYGGRGENDLLRGGIRMYGGPGGDNLVTSGPAFLDGGPGSDTCQIEGGSQPIEGLVRVNCELGSWWEGRL
jgi:Ca2+-binding RTX toxin-like protein